MSNFKVSIKQPELKQNTNEQFDNVFRQLVSYIDSLPLFLELGNDFSDLLKHARRFRSFDDVIIFGVGGSCLGGKLLTNFKETSGPNIHFVDNIDSYEWNKLFKNIDLSKTGVISISKSGNTTETLCQTLLAIQKWEDLPKSEHFLFITDYVDNSINEIAQCYDITCLNHPIGIGGRFSIFSVVGILPALIAGIDANMVIEGAKSVVDEFLKAGPNDENLVLKNAFFHNQLFEQKINISVLFCYSNRLIHFANWYSQLWSESLGKKSLFDESVRYGTTPVIALGAVDQHSQLQLYIDGPKDKLFTIITVGDHPETDLINIDGSINSSIARSLNGHMMSELMFAHQQVTAQSLIKEGLPVRIMNVSEFDEENLGKMLMFSILETIATACIWGIDPFNQPGVKNGKERVIEIMRG